MLLAGAAPRNNPASRWGRDGLVSLNDSPFYGSRAVMGTAVWDYQPATCRGYQGARPARTRSVTPGDGSASCSKSGSWNWFFFLPAIQAAWRDGGTTELSECTEGDSIRRRSADSVDSTFPPRRRGTSMTRPITCSVSGLLLPLWALRALWSPSQLPLSPPPAADTRPRTRCRIPAPSGRTPGRRGTAR